MGISQMMGGLNSAWSMFGYGTDGALAIDSDTNLTSTEDGDMGEKQYTTLTIDAAKTLTVANRCKGLLIRVQGDCTISGTLSMTGKGAYAAGWNCSPRETSLMLLSYYRRQNCLS